MTPERWEDLLPKLSRFGLLHFARVITRICVENLALPPEDAPWCMTANEGLCRALLEDILRTGNFGCKEERYGQRLFTDGRTENRLVSFFRTGVETCHTHCCLSRLPCWCCVTAGRERRENVRRFAPLPRTAAPESDRSFTTPFAPLNRRTRDRTECREAALHKRSLPFWHGITLR